jgi:ubiquinone biosynthesis protein Coq4
MDIPYLMRGMMPVETESSVLVSSSKYLNNPRMRDWLATMFLRKNGPDMPPHTDMYALLPILDELRDHDHIEAMIAEERKTNAKLDAWFSEGFVSSYEISDLAQYEPGTLGGIFHEQMSGGDYDIQIIPWTEPKSQLQFFNLRSGQTHDFEHILTGGGFNFMGELVPYGCRLTNVYKFIENKELASELSLTQTFGCMRYVMRTALHYPQVWETAVDALKRGFEVGQRSEPVFMAKMEDYFHLPLDEARAAIGVVGAEDIDTSREGEIWGDKRQLEDA